MLESGVSGENRVVRLNNRGGGLWSWVDTEFKFALFAIVDGQTLHEESSETRSSSTTERVEDEETLETSTVVCNTANLVQNLLNKLLANGVVTTGIVVGSILLSSDHVLWVEQAAVSTSADLIDDVWLEIAVDGTWDVFSLSYNLIRVSLTGRGDNRLLTELNGCLPVSEKKVLNP